MTTFFEYAIAFLILGLVIGVIVWLKKMLSPIGSNIGRAFFLSHLDTMPHLWYIIRITKEKTMTTTWIHKYETKTRVYTYLYSYGSVKPEIYWRKK